mgnify:CR=1 FL=1
MRVFDLIMAAIPEALGGVFATGLLGLLAYLLNRWQRNKRAAPQRILHNLPRREYTKFIGREKEFEEVINGLVSRAYLISIDGIGGIGKSTLALEVGYQYLNHQVVYQGKKLKKKHYYDAIIWTSARRFSLRKDGILMREQEIQNLHDILNAILITLKKDNALDNSLAKKREIARRALAEHRALLIIDNLETIEDDQLLEFLRELPEPTKALLTTRHRISETKIVHLEGLTRAASFKLAQAKAEELNLALKPEALERLFIRTGGVPLAIVWTIAKMEDVGINDAITSLHIDDTSIIAEFCFLEVVESIRKKEAYHTLLALSLFAQKANREALAFITEFPQALCNNTLIELEHFSLINKTPHNYWMLPLTKEFAIAQLQRPENAALRKKLQHRYADYYNYTKIVAVDKAKKSINAIHFALDLNALLVWNNEISDYLEANYQAIARGVEITRIFYLRKATTFISEEAREKISKIIQAQRENGVKTKILWEDDLIKNQVTAPPDMIIFDEQEIHVHIGSGGWYTEFDIFTEVKAVNLWLGKFHALEKLAISWDEFQKLKNTIK